MYIIDRSLLPVILCMFTWGLFMLRVFNSSALAAALAMVVQSGSVNAATLAPDPVIASDITLQIKQYAQTAPANLASPVAIEDDLYIVNQEGEILRKTASGFESVFTSSDSPAGISLTTNSAVLNLAGTADTAYVVLRSSTVPSGTPVNSLPDPSYASGAFDVVFRYDRGSDGSLTNPVALTAFESTTTPGGHVGGGLLVLPDGKLAFARGDNTGFRTDGLSGPQSNTETVGKIVLIDGTTGAVDVAASGIRNVQRMTYTDSSKTKIAFADIGATTAEEINVISVAELSDVSSIENFGWGRNADGNAREGTFYINDGELSVPGTLAEAIALAPIPEAGFVQPFAQFGREGVTGLFAVTGPVASESSFQQIGLLFGDLVNGSLFATRAGATGTLNDVLRVNLVDEFADPLALSAFNNGARVDARFFNFANGDAGVLLERTGQIFTLTEIAPVPLPSGVVLLLTALGTIVLRKPRVQV